MLVERGDVRVDHDLHHSLLSVRLVANSRLSAHTHENWIDIA